jgi:hypothetical protein
VFRAEDTRLRKRVAPKAVTTRHAARPEARVRLIREARAAAAPEPCLAPATWRRWRRWRRLQLAQATLT